MITPFKAKAEGVLVEVPVRSDDFILFEYDTGTWLCFWSDQYNDGWREQRKKLPPGDWQLVGTSDTMTEDDWKGIGICAPVDSKRYAVLILKNK